MRIIESGKTKQMADLNMVPLELQEALGAVIPEKDRETLQNMIAKGKSNWRIAAWLSARRGQIDTFQTVTGLNSIRKGAYAAFIHSLSG